MLLFSLECVSAAQSAQHGLMQFIHDRALVTQALLQDVSQRARNGKWALAGSLGGPPPGQACARQVVFRVADAGSRTLLAGIQLTNNLQVFSQGKGLFGPHICRPAFLRIM